MNKSLWKPRLISGPHGAIGMPKIHGEGPLHMHAVYQPKSQQDPDHFFLNPSWIPLRYTDPDQL